MGGTNVTVIIPTMKREKLRFRKVLWLAQLIYIKGDTASITSLISLLESLLSACRTVYLWFFIYHIDLSLSVSFFGYFFLSSLKN